MNGKERDNSVYNWDVILKTLNSLSKQRNKSDTLNWHLMFALILKSGEARLIKFKDMESKIAEYLKSL